MSTASKLLESLKKLNEEDKLDDEGHYIVDNNSKKVISGPYSDKDKAGNVLKGLHKDKEDYEVKQGKDIK